MMQYFPRLLVAVIAFLAGVAAVYYWAGVPQIAPVQDRYFNRSGDSPEPVSLCELKRDPQHYDTGKITVSGIITVINSTTATLDGAACGVWMRLSCAASYPDCSRIFAEHMSPPDGDRFPDPQFLDTVTGTFFSDAVEFTPDGQPYEVPLLMVNDMDYRSAAHGSGHGESTIDR